MRNVKTTAPVPADPQDVVARAAQSGKRRRGGGQPGNRNAQKHGAYARESMALRRQVTAWKRMTKVLIARAEKELALRDGMIDAP